MTLPEICELYPHSWLKRRLRFAAQMNPSKREVAGRPAHTEVSFVPMEAIGISGDVDTSGKRTLGDVASGYTFFGEGDVLVAKITPCFENGKGGIAQHLVGGIGFGTTELHVLRASNELDSRFLFYVTVSHPFRLVGQGEMSGAAGQKRVPENFILDFPLGLPELSLQRKIVSFLDRRITAIDALISKKERQIELLQEKRQALITRAVTKGLDPSTPMKASGIDWLGMIPSHWVVKRLRHISPRISVGVVVSPSQYVSTEGVPFLYGADVGEGFLRAQDARRISRDDSRRLAVSELHTGDLVTIRVGATRGWTAVIPPEFEGANCASIMITRRHESFFSDWLCQAMNSRIGMAQIEAIEYGAAQPQFNVSHATEFCFPVPPLGEQRAIARALISFQSTDRNRQELVSVSIERLREYRQALITAAVTGKIDVSKEAN